jgi:uncharacterized protein YukE
MGLDWSPFGGNPVPGDPGAVQGLAQQFRDFSDQVRQQTALLQNIHDGVGGVWTGPAAQSFTPHLSRLPGQLTELQASYGEAADALDGYWPQLQQAQSEAVSALAKAHAALQAQQAAKVAQQQDKQQHEAQQASVAQQSGAPFSPSPYVPSPGVVAQANAANAAYQAAVQLKDKAVSQANAAARRAAALLDGAASQQLSNPVGGLFSTLLSDLEAGGRDAEDFFRQHWAEISAALVAILGPGLLPLNPGDFNPKDLRDFLDQAGKAVAAFFQEHGKEVLEDISAFAGWAALTLDTIALIILVVPGVDLADIPLGAIAEILSVVKLGADAGLAYGYGDKEAQDELKWDALAVASAGLARVGKVGLEALRAAARAGDVSAMAAKLYSGAEMYASAAARFRELGATDMAAEAEATAKALWNQHVELLEAASDAVKEAHGVASTVDAIGHGVRSGLIQDITSWGFDNLAKEVPQLLNPGADLRMAASAAKLGTAPILAGIATVGAEAYEARETVQALRDHVQEVIDKYIEAQQSLPTGGPSPQPVPGPAPPQPAVAHPQHATT